jgi:hypothetical protein
MNHWEEWIKELCPELADWQVSIIAEAVGGAITEEHQIIAKLHEKVVMYETLLHKIHLYAAVTMNEEAVRDLIGNICNWSYAHRCGNGMHSYEEQQAIVRSAFEKLLDRRQ